MKADLYVIRFELGPYFKTALLHDIMNEWCSSHCYTLYYDETTNVQVKKQLDLVVRYWSDEQNRIAVRYFDLLFLGMHKQTCTVVKELLKTLADTR